MRKIGGSDGMTLRDSLFDVYIGVDYSGAGLPDKEIPGLAVVRAAGDEPPAVVRNPRHPLGRWSRSGLYGYLMSELAQTDRRVFVGIDHGFSYPKSELAYYGLRSWDAFLVWLSRHWDTRQSSVDACKKNGAPYRNADLLRLTEARYAVGASSVLDLDRTYGHMTKTVSYSTHAGLPWLAELRLRTERGRVQCWPYDHIFAPVEGGAGCPSDRRTYRGGGLSENMQGTSRLQGLASVRAIRHDALRPRDRRLRRRGVGAAARSGRRPRAVFSIGDAHVRRAANGRAGRLGAGLFVSGAVHVRLSRSLSYRSRWRFFIAK
ncbi:hypothetical protein [Cohnella rhizosphaerae]|uniref:DUF429 domain-containing protein n=1 Tax=Cohnella rhizosphaerae TaxID=1457232 RepID=A0A9X4KUZ8_9BACL|nr:hypothetical protein [Cohnella rhizosphaerae]MDG0810781.1 hypothetical protein [Cohnella rhizosphaerae]